MGCQQTQSLEHTLTPPSELQSISDEAPFLKAHLQSGDVVIFSEWSVEVGPQRIAGTGHRLGFNRDTLESGPMRVPVDQLMDTFDVWAKLNDIPLEELQFDRAKNMRKGKIKQLLLNNWNIEKASARMDGDIVRVYRPLELDSAVTKLAADIDTAA